MVEVYNKKIPFMRVSDTPEEKKLKRRLYMREYRKQNREKIKQYDRNYREKHKGDIARLNQNIEKTPEEIEKQKEYFKNYYNRNKKKMIENSKQYYKDNKHTIKELNKTRYRNMSDEEKIKLSIKMRLMYEKKCFEKGIIPSKYQPREKMSFEDIKLYMDNSEILKLIEKKEALDKEKKQIYLQRKKEHDKVVENRKKERDFRRQRKKYGNISRKIFSVERFTEYQPNPP